MNQGKGKIVVHSGEMYPNHTCCVLVVSGKLIREHPEIVRQIIKTNDKAVAYNEQNLDDAAAIFATKTGANLTDVKASLKEWDGNWASDPNVIVDPVLDYAKIQYDLGYHQEAPDQRRHLRPELLPEELRPLTPNLFLEVSTGTIMIIRSARSWGAGPRFRL